MITVIIPTYNHPSYISYLVKNSIDTYEGSLFRFQIHDSSEDNKTEEIVSKSKIYIKYFHYSKTFNADDKIISALKQVNSTYAYIMGDGCLPDFNKLENDLLKNSFSKYDLIGLVEAKNFNTKQKAIPYLKKSVFYENFELNYFASKFLYLLTYYGATIVSSAIIKFIIEQKLFEKFGADDMRLIYSLWTGYLDKPGYWHDLRDKLICIHTSGHACVKDLQDFVREVRPKYIIPIHTACKNKYADLFAAEVVALDEEDNFDKVREVIMQSGYSRIPVYQENLDNVRGILYVKDVLPYIASGDDFEWTNLCRKPYFVPEHKKINSLLEEFQTQKIHIAIVVDEYGSTLGLISLEDILEEIVGEISDESDVQQQFYTKIAADTYIFDGKTHLNDMLKVLGLDDDYLDNFRGDAETIAGLMLEIRRDFLHQGEVIYCRKLTLTAEVVSNYRIDKVRVVVGQ